MSVQQYIANNTSTLQLVTAKKAQLSDLSDVVGGAHNSSASSISFSQTLISIKSLSNCTAISSVHEGQRAQPVKVSISANFPTTTPIHLGAAITAKPPTPVSDKEIITPTQRQIP